MMVVLRKKYSHGFWPGVFTLIHVKTLSIIPALIERHRFLVPLQSNLSQINVTVIFKTLAKKVDFWAKCRSNQDCHSICASMESRILSVYYIIFSLWTLRNTVGNTSLELSVCISCPQKIINKTFPQV